MNTHHIAKIAVELKLAAGQVTAVANLFAEGGTIPFVARYRKEATGSLDEVALTNIRDRLAQPARGSDLRAAVKAVQIFGGKGYMEDCPAQRYLRDAKLCEIGEGTSEVQRMILARHLVRGR